MAASLGELVVQLSANIAKFEEAMTKAEQKSAITAQKISDSMESAKQAVVGLAAGFVGFKGVEAFTEGVEGAIKMGAELKRLSEQTGASVEALSKIKGASSEAGVEFGSVTNSLQKLSKNLVDAAQGGGKAVNAFAALGVNARQIVQTGVPVEEVFGTIAEKMAGMSNESQRINYATQIFGKTGADLIPVLLAMAEGGDRVAKVTEEQASRSHDLEVNINKLANAKKALYNTVAQQVLPVLQALTKTMLDATTGTGSLNAKAKELAQVNAIRQWATNAAIGLTMAIDAGKDLFNVIAFLGEAAVGAGAIFVDFAKVVVDGLSRATDAMHSFGDLLTGVGLILAGDFINGPKLVQQAWQSMKGSFSGFWGDMKAGLKEAGKDFDFIKERWDALADSFGKFGVTEAFLENLRKSEEGWKKTTKGAQEYALAVKAANDALTKLIQGFEKETASNNAQIAALQATGRELKATNVAKLEALLLDKNFQAVLAEQTKTRQTSVAALIAEARAAAAAADASAEELGRVKDTIEVRKKEHDQLWATHDAYVQQEKDLMQQIATYGQTAQGVTRYKMSLVELELSLAETALEQAKFNLALESTAGPATAEAVKNVDDLADKVGALRIALEKMGDVAELQGSLERMKNFTSAVSQAADYVGQLAVAFSQGVGKGIETARSMLRSFIQDLISLVARKWVISLVASAVGAGSTQDALVAQGAQLGMNTLAGQALNYMGLGSLGTGGVSGALWGATTFTETGLPEVTSGLFGTGGFAATMGNAAAGAAEAFGVAADSAAAFGETVAAAVPVIGWIVAIAAIAYSIWGHKGGGPKEQGAFAGTYDSSGHLLVSLGDGPQMVEITGDNTHSEDAQKYVDMTAKGFADTLKALGGTSGNFNFGGGFSMDPRGTAPSFVHSIVQDAMGNTIFKQNLDNVGRSQEEFSAALSLEAKRAILAALQHSDLPPAIATIINSVDALTASTEQLDAVMAKAAETASVMKGLAAINVNTLNLDSLKEMQQDGESLSQTFTRVAGSLAVFNDGLMTEAEKIGNLKTYLSEGFGSLGIAVPKNKAEFLALVRSIDFSTESGRHLYDTLVQLYPAFMKVAEAGDRAHEAFMGVKELIDQLNHVTPAQNGAALAAQFEAANPWAAGKSFDQLVSDFKTISEEDFSNYSEENQKLIRAILQLAVTTDNASTTISSAMQNIQFPETMAQQLEAAFTNSYNGLITGQPTKLDQMSMQATLMSQQIDKWREQAAGMDPYSAQYQALQTAINDFVSKLGKTTVDSRTGQTTTTGILGDISHLTELSAQYGTAKAEQLFDLDKWYDQQKELVGSNNEALLALEKLYGDKRKAIIEDSALAGADELAKIKESILQWRDSLLLSNLSPLTATQRFTTAATKYSDIFAKAAAGDTDALKQFQGAGTDYLQEALSYFGRASTQYQAIYNQVLMDSSALGGDTSFTPPSSQDIKDLDTTVREELRALSSRFEAKIAEQTSANSADTKILVDALDRLADKLSTFNEITA